MNTSGWVLTCVDMCDCEHVSGVYVPMCVCECVHQHSSLGDNEGDKAQRTQKTTSTLASLPSQKSTEAVT